MSKVEIVGTCEGAQLDKRTYLPGVVIKSTCPNCGTPWEKDLEHAYLSYPVVGVPVEAYGYCGACEHEWSVKVIVRMTLEVAPES